MPSRKPFEQIQPLVVSSGQGGCCQVLWVICMILEGNEMNLGLVRLLTFNMTNEVRHWWDIPILSSEILSFVGLRARLPTENWTSSWCRGLCQLSFLKITVPTIWQHGNSSRRGLIIYKLLHTEYIQILIIHIPIQLGQTVTTTSFCLIKRWHDVASLHSCSFCLNLYTSRNNYSRPDSFGRFEGFLVVLHLVSPIVSPEIRPNHSQR